ncbi:unnamed protein product [Candidula unifasciata]|uniref:Uncharacterized protein n=1 Tax=Candidula unifasciata TaxID=100452 RepID=A0A8S4A8P6_9EUPU|nr:unnamed protein product [Candidula unifasciata]
MNDKDKKLTPIKKADPGKPATTEENGVGHKTSKRTVIVKKVKQGAGSISRSGDFIGRLGTLLVMIVTTINTGTITVTSFIEGVYWKGGIHAALLLFLDLPMIAVMIWFMCKARMQSIYNKIRPSRPGQAATAKDVDVDNDVVVYEETVEVQDNNEQSQKDTAYRQKLKQRFTNLSRKAKLVNQKKQETKSVNNIKGAEQINKAFNNS